MKAIDGLVFGDGKDQGIRRGNDDFSALAKRTRIPNYPEKQLRLLNACYPDGELPAGALMKMVE